MNRKICFVGTEITPSEGSTFVGGHVNTVVMLCKGLSELGWKIHIVTTPSRFLRKVKFEFPWAEFHLIKPKGSYSSAVYGIDFFAKAVRTIESLNRREKFELVHAHSGYFSVAIIPFIVKKRLSIPTVFSLYCPAKLLPNALPLDKYCVKFLSADLNKIVAVSNNVKKSLLKFGVNETKIEVIPPCFDNEIFNPMILGNDSLNKSDLPSKTVLFVGNVDKAKGLDVFLKAGKLVLQQCPEAKFVITLHEKHNVINKVRSFASKMLGSVVDVKGVVGNMAELMGSVDVLAVPFRSTDGISDIPLVVLEAMAIGKPVVASNVGGIKEVMKNGINGLLVKPDDVGALAKAIINLLHDSKLKTRISREAIESVKHFYYRDVSKRLSDLYAQVIDEED
jgi:glycosyltransferase involved in cell wall biosynthesis